MSGGRGEIAGRLRAAQPAQAITQPLDGGDEPVEVHSRVGDAHRVRAEELVERLGDGPGGLGAGIWGGGCDCRRLSLCRFGGERSLGSGPQVLEGAHPCGLRVAGDPRLLAECLEERISRRGWDEAH